MAGAPPRPPRFPRIDAALPSQYNRRNQPGFRGPAAIANGSSGQHYWDDYHVHDRALHRQSAWLAASRSLYASWIRSLLRPGRRVLKTDAFEEIRGPEVAAALAEKFQSVVLTDIAHSALHRAAAHSPAARVQTPIQLLPFAPASFDAVASFSTLDHFRSTAEIEASLAGLATLTRPAGQLLITLDNPVNPLIALRNALPHSLLSSSGLAPYEYGRTLAPAAFRRALHAAGWRVLSLRGALHVPRVLAVAASPLLPARLLPRLVHSCEALSHLPTHYLTGHFLLALCERR